MSVVEIVLAIYSLGARIASAGFVWRMRRNHCWNKESVAQRSGRDLPTSSAHNPIWIHAASMGEVRVGAVLASEFASRGRTVLGSAMTETGYELLCSTYPKSTIPIRAPFDVRRPIARVLDHFEPAALVLVETELWPNLLMVAMRRDLPIFLVNGRLSDRAFPSYRCTRWFWRRILAGVSHFYMRSQVDAERMIALGVDSVRVEASGSLKSWDPPSNATIVIGPIPSERPVWIAGSTRPGEEEIILTAHTELRQSFPQVQLWLAPRHPERFVEVTALVQRAGLSVCKQSELVSLSGRCDTDVLLVDQMGILRELYGRARIAFVGGSLKPFGGHNPIEPAAHGTPVIFGLHMESQRDSAEMLVRSGLAVVVSSLSDIVQEVARVLQELDSNGARAARVARLKAQSAGVAGVIADDILRRIDESAMKRDLK